MLHRLRWIGILRNNPDIYIGMVIFSNDLILKCIRISLLHSWVDL